MTSSFNQTAASKNATRPVVLIAGPTASGKSAFALHLARLIDGEIINADASQIYRDLQTVSARPDEKAMAQVPHHLFGVMDGATACSTAMWRDLAVACIDAVWAKKRIPVLVGGTGLYLKTLLGGIADVPEIAADIRDEIRAMSTSDIRAALEQADSVMAARLNPADRQRQARALEVVRATGRSLSAWQRQRSGGLLDRANIGPVIKLVLLPERACLYHRCDARFADMVARGALAEVQALRDRQLDPALPVMKAVGVPELMAHLAGEASLAQAVTAACQATRNYAKRQYTWMRHQFGDWRVLQAFGEALVNDDLIILLREYGLTVK